MLTSGPPSTTFTQAGSNASDIILVTTADVAGASSEGFSTAQLPAAMAATYSHPDRLAVAVAGDGGYAMSLHGLMTAVENGRQLLVVVMDNQALGWVLHLQGERPYMSQFAQFDLAAIARAIGCTATEAHTEEDVRGAVAKAKQEPGVYVLVVRTSLAESFLTIQSAMAGVSHEQVTRPQD